MKGDILKEKRFSVLGAARSGVAAANLLVSLGKDVLLSDIKPELPEKFKKKLNKKVSLHLNGNKIRDNDIVVISPGIKPASKLFKMAHRIGKKVISEIELFYHAFNAPIIAITGTDGKSTTTKMIGDLLRAAGLNVFVGGNIGNPATEAFADSVKYDIAVCEISCFQLITTHELKPEVAVITNIEHDHIQYHGSFNAYQDAKKRVYKNMSSSDLLIINRDDRFINKWNIKTNAKIENFSLQGDENCDIYFKQDMLFYKNKPIFDWNNFPVPGIHNAANAMAAILAVQPFSVSIETVKHVLNNFVPLAHRMEFIKTINGVSFYNDSKATNPHAAMAGIKGLNKNIVVIAGGSEKGSDFKELADMLVKKAKAIVLIGETADRLEQLLSGRIEMYREFNFEKAIKKAYNIASSGDFVILSPACASYDMFNDYEHRGDTFRSIVQNMV